MFLRMQLNEEQYTKIKNRTKTVVMQLCEGKFRYITNRDVIEFINKEDENQTLEADVIGVHIYPTFNDLYSNFNKIELGYSEDEEANPSDMEAFFPAAKDEGICVVGIEIKLKD